VSSVLATGMPLEIVLRNVSMEPIWTVLVHVSAMQDGQAWPVTFGVMLHVHPVCKRMKIYARTAMVTSLATSVNYAYQLGTRHMTALFSVLMEPTMMAPVHVHAMQDGLEMLAQSGVIQNVIVVSRTTLKSVQNVQEIRRLRRVPHVYLTGQAKTAMYSAMKVKESMSSVLVLVSQDGQDLTVIHHAIPPATCAPKRTRISVPNVLVITTV